MFDNLMTFLFFPKKLISKKMILKKNQQTTTVTQHAMGNTTMKKGAIIIGALSINSHLPTAQSGQLKAMPRLSEHTV